MFGPVAGVLAWQRLMSLGGLVVRYSDLELGVISGALPFQHRQSFGKCQLVLRGTHSRQRLEGWDAAPPVVSG
jgi:hypothetical protein